MQYYDRKAVGERIKKIRLQTGMTQCRLAEKLDYTSERQLQRIESGATSCSVDKLMELAQILNVSTDYILFGHNKVYGNRWERYMEGKSDKQILYLEQVLKAAADNMELLAEERMLD